MNFWTPAILAWVSGAVFVVVAILWIWGVPRIDDRARGPGKTARVYRFGLGGGLGITGIGLAFAGLGYLGTVGTLGTLAGRSGVEPAGGTLATVGASIPATEIGGTCIVIGSLGLTASLLVVFIADFGKLLP